ncbi:MAG: redoxin domain-containing protein [Cyclobacteriaceae bacterium]|nr:redoxin domain-containing protein [Cyclobacteriaceae bacterium]
MVMITLGSKAQVRNFSLTNVVDGSTVSLESYPSCSGMVIVFTSNACPYDKYYTARLKHLITTYQGKIQFLLINSYTEPEESADKMKAAYDGWTLPVPYLADKDQVAMECLTARKSPEVFLLKSINGKYEVVFSGAIDDNAQVSAAVSETYLRASIDKLLAGQKIELTNVRPVGCTIRKK